eukprot:4306740-Amphidinium_carterae.1
MQGMQHNSVHPEALCARHMQQSMTRSATSTAELVQCSCSTTQHDVTSAWCFASSLSFQPLLAHSGNSRFEALPY